MVTRSTFDTLDITKDHLYRKIRDILIPKGAGMYSPTLNQSSCCLKPTTNMLTVQK